MCFYYIHFKSLFESSLKLLIDTIIITITIMIMMAVIEIIMMMMMIK